MALHAEAKPIIDYFKLKKIIQVNLPFTIFVNKDQTIHLIISGIGKTKMAAATTFLHLWTGSQSHHCFLNVGIAGSRQFSVGESVLVHKIIEKSTSKSWYPFVSLINIEKQTTLLTHDMPATSYPDIGMIDMEGAAFFETATHFVAQEQVQLFKIISDTDEKSLQELSKDKVAQLITANLPTLSMLINELMSLSRQENKLDASADLVEKFQSTWHFTHAQLLQLKESLRRWRIQIKNHNAWEHCRDEKNASHVLRKMVNKLDENCLY